MIVVCLYILNMPLEYSSKPLEDLWTLTVLKYHQQYYNNNLPEMICGFFDEITRFWKHVPKHKQLQGKVSEKMSNELEVLKNSLDRQQQYSRQNCMLTWGISEQKREHTNQRVLKINREEPGEAIEKSDLDRTHRTGAFQEDKNKCRTIIVKFLRYNVRDKVFKNKIKVIQ